MSVKWEKQEGNQGLLTVTVASVEVDKAIDSAFKKVVKQINVPGFRKGKMPRPMFEKMYGVEALYQDALEIVINSSYPTALDESGVEPVD
ncbi:MAG: trigger factor family protein, partial [Solibacillus sp.]